MADTSYERGFNDAAKLDEAQIDKLKCLNGELCAEINDKDRRIAALQAKAEKAEQYRRQLGGMQAAYNRLKRRCVKMEAVLADARRIIENELPPHCHSRIDERMKALRIEVD